MRSGMGMGMVTVGDCDDDESSFSDGMGSCGDEWCEHSCHGSIIGSVGALQTIDAHAGATFNSCRDLGDNIGVHI